MISVEVEQANLLPAADSRRLLGSNKLYLLSKGQWPICFGSYFDYLKDGGLW